VLHRQKHPPIRQFASEHLCQSIDDDDGTVSSTRTSHGNGQMSFSFSDIEWKKESNEFLNAL
jgi:hypothetical protein